MNSKDAMEVRIKDGYIYVDIAIHELYFPGIQAVVLVRHATKNLVMMMPVHNQASGGLLMKVRNKRGDRVVAAMDFLRSIEITDEQEICCPVYWDADYHGLALPLFSSTAS